MHLGNPAPLAAVIRIAADQQDRELRLLRAPFCDQLHPSPIGQHDIAYDQGDGRGVLGKECSRFRGRRSRNHHIAGRLERLCNDGAHLVRIFHHKNLLSVPWELLQNKRRGLFLSR